MSHTSLRARVQILWIHFRLRLQDEEELDSDEQEKAHELERDPGDCVRTSAGLSSNE